ncbi:MAG: lauroyl acyltransferase [Fibrobacteraceae bacterium]|nr:lauroyl acyltransferase [Fibrobacteraceae bacterium]
MTVLYKIIVKLLLAMPPFLQNAVFNVVYPIYKVLHIHRAWGRVRNHLARTGMDKRTSPRAVFKRLFENYLDSLRYLMRYPKTLQSIRFENEEIIQKPLAEGMPIIAMSIHQGAFEMLHRILTKYSSHVYLFTHSFKNKALTEFLRNVRKTDGLEERDTDTVAHTLREFFKNKGILAMLVDQATEARGNEVQILGVPSTLFLRLPLQVLRMGGGIVTFRTFKTNKGHTIRFEHFYPPRSDEAQTEKSIANEISLWISEHPSDWTWNYHRNFTTG